jgi:hypothetical protein
MHRVPLLGLGQENGIGGRSDQRGRGAFSADIAGLTNFAGFLPTLLGMAASLLTPVCYAAPGKT